MWHFVQPMGDAEIQDGMWHLDFVLSHWTATPAQRRMWRTLSERLARQLGGNQAPALVPGLVQARLGTALLLGGYLGPPLPSLRILTLGAHAGLELRMLRDWGAEAIGIERNLTLVRAGIQTEVVGTEALLAAEATDYLTRSCSVTHAYDLILILAPSDPAWPTWVDQASARLAPDGQLVVVAYWSDLPVGWRTLATPCLEGTMGGLLVRRR
jgi:hypothetical protein